MASISMFLEAESHDPRTSRWNKITGKSGSGMATVIAPRIASATGSGSEMMTPSSAVRMAGSPQVTVMNGPMTNCPSNGGNIAAMP